MALVTDEDPDRPAAATSRSGTVRAARARGRGMGAATALVRLLGSSRPGKGPMAAAAWANGARPFGQRLGDTAGDESGGGS